MRKIEQLKHWQFHRDNLPEEAVAVPHDWAIYGPFDRGNDRQLVRIVQDGEEHASEHNGRTGGLPHVGHGEYRCRIAGASVPGNRVYLDFDGVMSHAKVYVNGQLAGSRNYGYSSFRVDATDFLHDGEDNELLVTVDNPPDASRWYPGAGIYRRVQRIETAAVHFAQYTPWVEFLPEAGQIRVSGRLENHAAISGGADSARIAFKSPLFDDRVISLPLEADGAQFCEMFELKSFELWDVESPALYEVMLSLDSEAGGDEVVVRTGLRMLKFDGDRGFFLNGRRTPIQGVCLHHDLGPLGAAFNRAAARRQLEIMRQMGCNAIRTSHNPPAPELLDLCDEMGFLVMDEAFDMWRNPKIKNDYSRHFDDDSELDLSTLVLRDRNHPSVILWSIGNEVPEIRLPICDGAETAARLTAIVKRYDASRPVTAAFDNGMMAVEKGLAAEVDIPGWNYHPFRYAHFHRLFPHVPVLGSETLSTLSSRGVYYFPADEYVYGRSPRRQEHDELQCSSYCLDLCPWCQTADAEQLGQEEGDYVMGQFIWTGFDYLGEPTPYNAEWPARSSYFGCVDLVGLPKELFYLMQSLWTDKPMVHICPSHWNWERGQKLDIHVFTNCEQAELYINGCPVPGGARGRMIGSSNLAERYRIIWRDVEWRQGQIRAVGYGRDGIRRAEDAIFTADVPVRLSLETGRANCHADGEDMVFVTVGVTDKAGVPYPHAANCVSFTLEGESLRLVAADGGNAASVEPFQTPECTLFSGKAVVYLRSTGKAGTTLLRATAEGLQDASIELHAGN